MEEDDKKQSGCCFLVFYKSLRRHPIPVSPLKSTRPSPSSNVAINNPNPPTNPSQPSIPFFPPNRTKPLSPNPKPKLTIADPVPRPRYLGISSELNDMIYDHQQTKASSTLVRASSGNVMLFGHLGNLRPPKTAKERNPVNRVVEPAVSRALSRKLDPEDLKELGNEEYRNGRYAEAIVFYDRAMLIDPKKASYWSNKAAALTALGRLLDAVEECREAIRIDPYYFRAHQRLAGLYLRLGEAERAAKHYKLAKNEASYDDISRANTTMIVIGKCSEARNSRDWSNLLKESQAAISAGADSTPQIFAYQAEAFLMLLRLEEAEESMIDAPIFDTDASTKFFGAPRNAYYLSVKAQVDMAAGKFEKAVSLAQMAAQINPGSKEIANVARKTRSVASARSMGNNLFKDSKFVEACLAYGNGLKHDPHNAILLCNRAACQFKLGQWQKAVEDCNLALKLRPKYSKARLRRAECNVKLEQWDASVKDYEILILEMRGDEAVMKALEEAKEHQTRHIVGGNTEDENSSDED